MYVSCHFSPPDHIPPASLLFNLLYICMAIVCLVVIDPQEVFLVTDMYIKS